VHQLFIDFKNAYDSVRKEVLYNILTEFGIPMKLLRLVNVHLTETYGRVWVGKNLSYMFPSRNDLNQGDALSPLLFSFALEYAINRVQVKQDGLKLNGTFCSTKIKRPDTWCYNKFRELIAVKVLHTSLMNTNHRDRLQCSPLGKLCTDASA